MIDIGHRFAHWLEAGDLSDAAEIMLHRVQMTDGLRLFVGRDQIVERLLEVAASFDERSVMTLATERGDGIAFAALELRGRPAARFSAGAGLDVRDGVGALDMHVWCRLEAERIVEIELVADWGAWRNDGTAQLAEAHGAAYPAHRPLGELASGRAQLMAAPGNDLAAQFNSRALAGRADLLALVATIPDSRMTADLAAGGARLWRLQGHVNGRRVSLPVSSPNGLQILVDRLAIEASAHRPFWPD